MEEKYSLHPLMRILARGYTSILPDCLKPYVAPFLADYKFGREILRFSADERGWRHPNLEELSKRTLKFIEERKTRGKEQETEENGSVE